jgi:hypothetical protein
MKAVFFFSVWHNFGTLREKGSLCSDFGHKAKLVRVGACENYSRRMQNLDCQLMLEQADNWLDSLYRPPGVGPSGDINRSGR